jgi:SpoVK/Ycf46/Vps4 family AAA+-type ATPase
MNLDENINLDDVSSMCIGFTGADVKSAVCDALVKAFHRAHNSLSMNDGLEIDTLKSEENASISQEKLRNSIRIEEKDLISSINTIKQSINQSERTRLKNM